MRNGLPPSNVGQGLIPGRAWDQKQAVVCFHGNIGNGFGAIKDMTDVQGRINANKIVLLAPSRHLTAQPANSEQTALGLD